MNEDKLKEALRAVLQYGWLWGHPKHIAREDWDIIRDVYQELNNGKEFKPDRTKRAT